MSVSRELQGSIQSILGSNVRIIQVCAARLEIRPEKCSNRVLVLTPCRILVFTAKIPSKAIESKKASQLCLSSAEKSHTFYFPTDENGKKLDIFISSILTEVEDLFPGIPLERIIHRIDVVPPTRLERFLGSKISRKSVEFTLPCHGFSRQYACMCDYFALPYRDEVAWDIDTIYLSNSCRELNLKDFDHLDPKDLLPIISALEFNLWFKSFRGNASKLQAEALDRLLIVVSKSFCMEELHLENMGFRCDFAQKLSLAIANNANSTLAKLDLSHNLIEDKGVSYLGSALSSHANGFVSLSFSHCGLTGKGIHALQHALSNNTVFSSSLSYLNLSGNSLRDDVKHLCCFLAHSNVVSHLDLTATELTVESIFGALSLGCTTHLSHLYLSKNNFTTKKSRELPPSFKQFFTSGLALRNIRLASCKITLEALKNLLLGLACNETIEGVHLDLSCNSLSGSGAQIIESCIHGVGCLNSLDLTENNIDVDLGTLVQSLNKNKSLQTVYLGKNLHNLKAKYVAVVMESFVQVFQDTDCVIEALYLPDSKLKLELYNFINALGSNHCLEYVDISGNMIGDQGVRLLTKALQLNRTLRVISLDRNNVTWQGFADLAYGLETNRTLRHIPYPAHDMTASLKLAPEKTEANWRRIEELLQRNITPRPPAEIAGSKWQQAFLTNTATQELNRLSAELLDHLRDGTGKESEEHSRRDNINMAFDVVQAKELLGSLLQTVQEKSQSSEIAEKLASMAADLEVLASSHLQDVASSLAECAEAKCPGVCRKPGMLEQLKNILLKKLVVPPDFIRRALVSLTGAQVSDKLNELSFAAATSVHDCVVGDVVKDLSNSSKHLLMPDHKRNYAARTKLPTPLLDVARRSSSSDSSNLASEVTPVVSPDLSIKHLDASLSKLRPLFVTQYESPEGTPESLSEAARPTSWQEGPVVQGEPEGEDEMVEGDEKAQASGKRTTREGGGVFPLKHLGLLRPRRPKTRMPSRSALRAPDFVAATLHESEESLDMEPSQDVDSFFQPNTDSSCGGSLASIASGCFSLNSPLQEDKVINTSADNSPAHKPSGLPVMAERQTASLPRTVVGLKEEISTKKTTDFKNSKRQSELWLENNGTATTITSNTEEKKESPRLGVGVLSNFFMRGAKEKVVSPVISRKGSYKGESNANHAPAHGKSADSDPGSVEAPGGVLESDDASTANESEPALPPRPGTAKPKPPPVLRPKPRPTSVLGTGVRAGEGSNLLVRASTNGELPDDSSSAAQSTTPEVEPKLSEESFA